MSEREQTGIRTLAKAFETLPDGKKEFLLGYAEGVIAARDPDERALQEHGPGEKDSESPSN